MKLDFSDAGYIYILTNESLGNLIKIGYTQNDPEDRAKELYTTGVPTPYRVWSYTLVENANAVEEAVHVALFKNRSNRDREFFLIDPTEAKKVIDSIVLEQREEFLRSRKKLQNAKYNNPKFVELIKFLKTNQGKTFSAEDLALELKISQKGVGQLIYMLESQETTVLYTNPDPKQNKKYGIYVKFGLEQLNILEKKYTNMDFSDIRHIFENKEKKSFQKNKETNNKDEKQNYKNRNFNRFNPLNYNNPKFIQLIKVLKENQGNKMLTSSEIAERMNKDKDSEGQPKISPEGVRKIINLLENHQFDIVFIVPETEKSDERFAIDFKFNINRLKELDVAYPKMNLSVLYPLFDDKEKELKARHKTPEIKESVQHIQKREMPQKDIDTQKKQPNIQNNSKIEPDKIKEEQIQTEKKEEKPYRRKTKRLPFSI